MAGAVLRKIGVVLLCLKAHLPKVIPLYEAAPRPVAAL